jgi:uncharacterized integral membrane protein
MSTDDETVTLGDRVPGRRVVLTVYLAIVGIAGLLGLVLGLVNPEGMDPKLFFLVDLPPTPLGMVVFGTTTVGALLGVLLLAVHYVSRYDDGPVA